MNREIKRSKSLRAWNKYKKLVYVVAVLLALLITVIVVIAISLGGKNKDKKPSQTETEAITTESESDSDIGVETNPFTGEPITETESWSIEETVSETETVTEETTVDSKNLVKTPTNEKFTNEAFYSDAAFIGDSFVSGIDTYGYLPKNKLVYDGNWTTGKASNHMTEVGATNANKVFVEIGLNDLNTGKSGEKVFESYKELINDIKGKLPNAKIYAISVFPVTNGFEAKSSTGVTNTEIQNLNNLIATLDGVTYLNVSASLSNSDGSLNTDLSTSGYNIKNTYYGFILNLIAEMCN